MINRLGILAPPGRGHLYPATALGRRLKKRGYQVTVFDQRTARAVVAASGLLFQAIDITDKHSGAWAASEKMVGPRSLNVLHAHALLVLRNAYRALADAKVEALLVDQADLAGGTLADRLGIPFINLSMFPPVFLSEDVPPFIFPWTYRDDNRARLRNRRGNTVFSRLFDPILSDVNQARAQWKLPDFASLNDVFSKRAIVSQLPRILDFPRTVDPPPVCYTGPFNDGLGRPAVAFPWSSLNGKRIVYASMGTVRCASKQVFETIAAACARFDLQLIMTLGGMDLTPSDIECAPADAIIVHFAPQTELLRKAALCITHGGMNTVLDATASGVPLIVIPVTDDQPGVAARIEWLGAGLSLPLRRLSIERLTERIEAVLSNPGFLHVAKSLEMEMKQIDGLELAAEMIESRLAIS